jgi:cytochrome c556
VRIILGEEMREHMATVNEVLGYLGRGQLERAAEVAEARMGLSSTGKHRGTGMGPGRYMTPEMRQTGRAMHESATRFAEIAAQGDLAASVAAFQTITAHCVACHNAYRVR